MDYNVTDEELPVVGPGLALHLFHVLNGHVTDLGVLDDQVRKQLLKMSVYSSFKSSERA